MASSRSEASKSTEGDTRRVGVEIEFGDIERDAICDAVVAVFGGRATVDSDFEAKVETPELGVFRVELDAELLRERAREHGRTDGVDASVLAQQLVSKVATYFVPWEIVTPPLPRARLAALDDLVAELAARGATGTGEKVTSAFGVHFNPELADLQAESLRDHIVAFSLLYDWLARETTVDFTRRLSPFIAPYPRDYVMLVLAEGYHPSLSGLVDDYLEHNPTRNRALDMLPAFAHLDEQRVRNCLPDEKINKRPTFHYRMSNSRVGEAGWRLTDEWRRWLEVERLAIDESGRQELVARYRSLLANRVESFFSDWAEETANRIGADR